MNGKDLPPQQHMCMRICMPLYVCERHMCVGGLYTQAHMFPYLSIDLYVFTCLYI